jgi:hypothetical protein
MSTASKVAERKERHPELYCPKDRCLWHTGGGYCPRHFKETLKTNSNPNPVFQDFIDGWAEKNAKVIHDYDRR